MTPGCGIALAQSILALILRDAELSGLRAEIHEALGNRNVSDEQFKNGTLDELSSLKAAVQLEREERIAEDDEIVQVGGWGASLPNALASLQLWEAFCGSPGLFWLIGLTHCLLCTVGY